MGFWEYTADELDEAVRDAIAYEKSRYMQECGVDLNDYPDYLADVERQVRAGWPGGLVYLFIVRGTQVPYNLKLKD